MSQKSNLKTNPLACPLAKKCGGCQLQNMTYERQLKWKQARCEILLKKYGKIRRIIGMENPLHYRNKVHASFARDQRENMTRRYDQAVAILSQLDFNHPDREKTEVRKCSFGTLRRTRERIRADAANTALDMVRRRLTGDEDPR